MADITAYEAAANPDGGAFDSNPNSVTSKRGRVFVVDAGGNSLLRVHRSGEISTVAVFPDRPVTPPPGMDLPDPFPMQAVPTNVIPGPDGALYVSQLTGFPFIPGAARIYRVERGSAPEIYADGLTNVTDLAFDRHGNLYVVEIAANGLASGDPTGALIKIRPDGSRETVLSEGLVNPYGVAIGDRGDIYVTNHGASAGVGEVLRIGAVTTTRAALYSMAPRTAAWASARGRPVARSRSTAAIRIWPTMWSADRLPVSSSTEFASAAARIAAERASAGSSPSR